MQISEDTLMRPQRQHVPQAPHSAHGQLSFVFSAPVCLFPSCRPQDSLLNLFCAAPARSPSQIAWGLLAWMNGKRCW